nr:hypothetical protein [Tanacetum cinerariifolium]
RYRNSSLLKKIAMERPGSMIVSSSQSMPQRKGSSHPTMEKSNIHAVQMVISKLQESPVFALGEPRSRPCMI